MLKVTNLSFSFPHHQLFKDISFEVQSGQALHLYGANGAGKSTLIKVLAGLLNASSGKVHYPSQLGRADIEYMPSEANGLYLKLTALDNLRFWLRLRGLETDDDAILKALQQWGVIHRSVHQHMPVDKFSTGMRRRLSLARIALSPARLWLLDEPIYGLDEKAVQLFRGLLQKHLQAGGALVIISHEKQVLDGLITQTLSLGGG